ncbi:L,D-transpeptidase family protein [Helicobacter cetorum]|uniref:cell shape-determining L,D-carboxypeptidase Csd6 n=1 Tax=Helicobacter cetorum TaxID=138563 RepID=UPI000CF0ED16|nr:murein L,D-transpeptidase family protein [Helicobacter cetorum]
MKKMLFALLACAWSLDTMHANERLLEILSIYQKQGLQSVGEKLDSYMKDKSFWMDELKDKDTDYGYYENKRFLFVANKSKPSLSLYKIQDNMLEKINDSKALVGSKKGDKIVEGDLATPIGVYRITQKLQHLDQYYGPLAFVTNYPNLYDTLKKRTGHGIWVHGMPLNGDRHELNTKGCIAIENQILSSYDNLLKGEKALLIVYENQFLPSSKGELATILSALYQWKEAWIKGDFERYMDFYNKNFTRYDGMKKSAFREYKKRVFAKKEKKSISFSSINIVPYPNSENKRLFYVVFDQDYKAYQQAKLSYTSNARKELYVEVKDNEMSILIEK